MADDMDISRSLGRIEGVLQELTKAVEDDRESATDWRKSVYRRLEDHADQINRLSKDIAITGEISAQARDHAKSIEERIDKEVAPDLKEWRKTKAMGMGMMALLGIGGTMILSAMGVVLSYFGGAIATAIRGALRIP